MPWADVYSTWSNGSPPGVAALLKDSAIRVPLPLVRRTRALPLTQPGRFTASWMIPARLGLRCASPASPTFNHGSTVHAVDAAVVALPEMSPFTAAKVGGLSQPDPYGQRGCAPVGRLFGGELQKGGRDVGARRKGDVPEAGPDHEIRLVIGHQVEVGIAEHDDVRGAFLRVVRTRRHADVEGWTPLVPVNVSVASSKAENSLSLAVRRST